MRKFKVGSWEEGPKGDKQKVTIIDVIKNLMNSQDPTKVPRGIDKFRTFSRLSKAFDESEKTGFVEVEQADFRFLKDLVEKDIPAKFALMSEVTDAVELMLDAEDTGKANTVDQTP